MDDAGITYNTPENSEMIHSTSGYEKFEGLLNNREQKLIFKLLVTLNCCQASFTTVV